MEKTNVAEESDIVQIHRSAAGKTDFSIWLRYDPLPFCQIIGNQNPCIRPYNIKHANINSTRAILFFGCDLMFGSRCSYHTLCPNQTT